MADARIESFLKSAPGKYFDPDGVYKFQCVDVILAYALHLWPDAGIRESVGWGNAKDYLDGRPVKYWKAVRNVWGSAALPPRGAVCVWGGPNTTYGHVAVNLGATQAGVSGLQQNVAGGGNEPTTIGFLPWDLGSAGIFIGWLEPVLTTVNTASIAKDKDDMPYLDWPKKDREEMVKDFWRYKTADEKIHLGHDAYWWLLNPGYNVWRTRLKSVTGKTYQAASFIINNNGNGWKIPGLEKLVQAIASKMLTRTELDAAVEQINENTEAAMVDAVIDVEVSVNGKDA